MESITVTDEQRLYLQEIFDYFHEYGKWPLYSHLERIFLQSHPDIDIDEVVESLPPGLSKPLRSYTFASNSGANEDAILTIQAIYLCRGSDEELTDFIRFIHFCVEWYYSSDKDNRQVSSSDLIFELNMSDLSTRKIGLLLQIEPWIFTSLSSGDEGKWQCTLSREVRRFRDVKTIEQYLEKRDRQKDSKNYSALLEPPGSIIVTEMGNLEIHPGINTKCWDLYIARKYDDAILNATKALEVAIRTKANLPQSVIGVNVINIAFNPKTPLLLYSKVDAEQEGMMSLLRGIIRVFKNHQSHRFVGVQSKSECLGVLLMCSNLLYVVDNATYVG